MIKNSRTLIERIRELEKIDFPEFKNPDPMLDSRIYSPKPELGQISYCYFSPSWHFESGLMNYDIASDIRKNGKTVLSIGSGPAYLERFLVNHFDIKSEQIVLSDVEAKYLPEGFQKYLFDITKGWPQFNGKFDYIFFPESLGVARDLAEMQEDLPKAYAKILKKALTHLKEDGQVRAGGHCEQNFRNLEAIEKILKKAYPRATLDYTKRLIILKPFGENPECKN